MGAGGIDLYGWGLRVGRLWGLGGRMTYTPMGCVHCGMLYAGAWEPIQIAGGTEAPLLSLSAPYVRHQAFSLVLKKAFQKVIITYLQ